MYMWRVELFNTPTDVEGYEHMFWHGMYSSSPYNIPTLGSCPAYRESIERHPMITQEVDSDKLHDLVCRKRAHFGFCSINQLTNWIDMRVASELNELKKKNEMALAVCSLYDVNPTHSFVAPRQMVSAEATRLGFIDLEDVYEPLIKEDHLLTWW